ncbi:SigE family RNA polymerase sigma factor, partial [Streptomyces prasinopilosus]|uniref:SigE family RNA polymerase sigma factor n=1 Tax=Streptomyces prasinopilosus TaxID=67344 RepID=UPI0006EB7148
MNTLHGTGNSAVVTRLHDVHRGGEKTGAATKRGCGRGTGRHTGFMTVIDAPTGGTGETHGGSAYGEEQGERRSLPEAEFTAYVRERRASLYATAYHLTGDRFEAEDLLQSALFSTYRAWDRISDKAAVGGYLRRTMTNLHISAWRRRKLNEYPTEELPETVGDTDAMRGTELRAVLWQALARLPQDRA